MTEITIMTECANPKIDQLEDLLPQTQCGLCEYTGCRPYAAAIVTDGEAIDRCLPGGVRTLERLATATGQGHEHLIEGMKKKEKPAMLAVIREEECIGCTKCIQACPVDAIIGASKQMHTIIVDACNGCELCLPPCPVDCIDLLELPARAPEQQDVLAKQSKTRFEQRENRLSRNKMEKTQSHQAAKLQQSQQKQTLAARKAAIAASVKRVRDSNTS